MTKIIEVNIPLFNIASIELPIAGEEIIDSDIFRVKGIELLERLHIVADIVDILAQDAWFIVGEVFNLCAYREDIKSVEEAKSRLRRLGINLSNVFITEYNEELIEDGS